MATGDRSDDPRAAEVKAVNLRGAWFVAADLSSLVMRSVEHREADIDAPCLLKGDSFRR